MSLPAGPGASGASFLASADIPTLQVGATTARLVATGSMTEERYGLFRWDMTGESGGATPHFHRMFSEAFYVLEGTVAVYDGSDWREARPGDFLYVPPSGVHSFRNDSRASASMLILFAPGPPREAYFRELGDRIASGRRYSGTERAEFLARHDQYEV